SSNSTSDGCAPGTLGCPCDSGACGTVGNEALVCIAGTCQGQPDDTCPVGTQGCACGAGDVCGLSGSGTQMQCAEGVCAEPSCDAGSIG
ncbi:MAG: hypothetical protein AAFX99_15500, partial [Myxococcota bacterium]